MTVGLTGYVGTIFLAPEAKANDAHKAYTEILSARRDRKEKMIVQASHCKDDR